MSKVEVHMTEARKDALRSVRQGRVYYSPSTGQFELRRPGLDPAPVERAQRRTLGELRRAGMFLAVDAVEDGFVPLELSDLGLESI